jgi:hypothetical protein
VNKAVRSCAIVSSLAATFVGASGEDIVGPTTLTPSGVLDWRIQLTGLRGTPTRVQITSTDGGIWEGPFNGSNWVILPQYGTGGVGDLFYEPWGTPGFHVKVWYSDGTSDEVGVL